MHGEPFTDIGKSRHRQRNPIWREDIEQNSDCGEQGANENEKAPGVVTEAIRGTLEYVRDPYNFRTFAVLPPLSKRT